MLGLYIHLYWEAILEKALILIYLKCYSWLSKNIFCHWLTFHAVYFCYALFKVPDAEPQKKKPKHELESSTPTPAVKFFSIFLYSVPKMRERKCWVIFLEKELLKSINTVSLFVKIFIFAVKKKTRAHRLTEVDSFLGSPKKRRRKLNQRWKLRGCLNKKGVSSIPNNFPSTCDILHKLRVLIHILLF